MYIVVKTNLEFNISDFCVGPDDGSSHHRWENMSWKVAAGKSALDKLKRTN
jgi:hypothetical protein